MKLLNFLRRILKISAYVSVFIDVISYAMDKLEPLLETQKTEPEPLKKIENENLS